nr:unnamed protein product [Digitaria exilis]
MLLLFVLRHQANTTTTPPPPPPDLHHPLSLCLLSNIVAKNSKGTTPKQTQAALETTILGNARAGDQAIMDFKCSMSIPLQASKSRFVVGSHVWVEDPDEAWMDGLVEEINGDELVINCTSGKKVTANVSSAYPKDTESPRGGVEDMTRLAYLHEPGVLQNLKSRYALNEIYVTQAEGRSVQQQILESNPVLEAFGNAKTVRNNNSSRFGKFVEIQFDENGKISGAAIRTYLLERSRVCQISDPERNYHCFYMLCAAPPEDCKKYKLGDPRSFHYLNQSNCIALDAMDDSKEYMETRRAMGIVGISSDEQDAIFRVVAAILHLGNVEFAEGSEADSSVPKDEKSQFHLKTAAELFMYIISVALSCDEKGLEESLCKRVMATRGESITRNLDPRAAALSRDALARIVYSRLFDWLVNKINSSIGQDPDSKILIGVLDIYGFESFLTNRCLTGMPLHLICHLCSHTHRNSHI